MNKIEITVDKIWDEILSLRSRIDDFDDIICENHYYETHILIYDYAYNTINQLLSQWTEVQKSVRKDISK